MRIAQTCTFYPGYLDEFYQKRPNAPGLPYAEQLRLLLADGYGVGHILTPALRTLGHDAACYVINARPLQEQWCREHGVPFPDDWPQAMSEIALRQVAEFAPEILYTLDPLVMDSSFVRRLPRRPRLVLGWRAASIPEWVDWSDFDAMLSAGRHCLETSLERGARAAIYAIPGFPAEIAQAVRDVPKSRDVVFCGSFTSEHAGRNRLLTELAKAPLGVRPPLRPDYFLYAADPGAMSAGMAMHDHGPRWGMDMYRTLASARIAVSAGIDIADGEAPSMRLFEATACGAFLLTERQFNIEAFFTPGEEIETFADDAELVDKTYYYLAHPRQREAIAARGRERCLRDYATSVRARAWSRLARRLLGEAERDGDFGRELRLAEGLDAEGDTAGARQAAGREVLAHPDNDEARQFLSGLMLRACSKAAPSCKEGKE